MPLNEKFILPPLLSPLSKVTDAPGPEADFGGCSLCCW